MHSDRSPEQRSLLLATHPSPPEGVEAELDRLMSDPHFDWKALLDLLVRHRVFATAFSAFETLGVRGRLPSPYAQFLEQARAGNWKRNESLLGALSEVLSHLRESTDATVLVRKGLYLALRVHADLGSRLMNDIDLLADRERAAEVAQALLGIGFEAGRITPGARTIEPWTRKESVLLKMTAARIPTLLRLSDDPLVPVLAVDIATSLVEPKTGLRFAIAPVLERSVEVDLRGVGARVMDPADFMIDLCTHLYKHSKSLLCVERGDDLVLSRFQDVALFARHLAQEGAWKPFVERVELCGLQEPTYLALAFTDEVYPGSIPTEQLDRLRPPNLGYLYRSGDHEDQGEDWPEPGVRRRMFDESRAERAAGRSRSPLR